MSSLFSDFLTALGVKHTEEYSDSRFSDMPFKSMFGLVNLLKEYNIGATGLKVDPASKSAALEKFPVPFLADTDDGFAIVTKVASGNVTYMSQHKTFVTTLSKFENGWNGITLLASPDDTSCEPEYTRHHIAEIFVRVKAWMLIALAAALFLFSMFATPLYTHWYAWALALLDIVGILLSWMLVQKSLGIHNNTAEAMCSALQQGGCDEIARSEASSFLGIVKWSEVGLSYFSISLMAILLFPDSLEALAAINILCLPYTVWSITYQKFVAKTWCTLCVCVQITLWLLFFAYLFGGITSQILPFTTAFWIDFIVLGCCFVALLLGINHFDDSIQKYVKSNTTSL